MGQERGHNIIFDPKAVERARRNDLRRHLRGYESALRIAEERGEEGDTSLFRGRIDEIKKHIRAVSS